MRIFTNIKGATSIEYAAIAACMCIIILASLSFVGDAGQEHFEYVTEELESKFQPASGNVTSIAPDSEEYQ